MALPFKYYILNEQEIESGALDLRYYTKTQADGRYVLKETGKQLIESTILTDLTDGGNTTLHKHDDKADKIYATNLVTNGDFSNGTTGWSSVGSTISATNNTLSIVGTGALAHAGSFFSFPTRLANRKYYWKLKIRTTSTGSTHMRCFCNSVTTDRTIVAVANPVQNQWYEASVVLSPIVDISNIQCYLYYATAPEIVNKTMEVQYVLGVDLTTLFGAGNEPTKEQIDRLLSTYPNSWFNGTAEITNIKQVFNEKADRLFATNLVTNGDFSNGTTGWTKTSNCTFVVNNGIAEIVASATNNGIYKNIVGATNNIFYIFSKIQSTSTQVALYNFSAGTAAYSDGSNQMKFVSLRSTISTNANIGVSDLRTSGWDMFKTDDIGAINLTTLFGAGKEPTKEQMDWLLAQKFTNSWFNGTAELTSITDLLTLVNTKANITQEAWITPTLLNGATTDGANPVKYFKDTLGIVHFKGRLIVANANVDQISMPVGYRTSPPQYFVVPLTTDATTIRRCDVSPNVKLYHTGTFDLSSLCYKAEA